MTPEFRLGLPEAAGLAIVGSTIGALLGGAAAGDLTVFGAICAVAGGVIPFVAVLVLRTNRGA
jgi:hypothetical protein